MLNFPNILELGTYDGSYWFNQRFTVEENKKYFKRNIVQRSRKNYSQLNTFQKTIYYEYQSFNKELSYHLRSIVTY